MSKDFRNEPIAIVGVSAIFPGSLDATGFWKDILGGSDLVRDIPESHWLIDDYYDADPAKPDKTYAKRGAFLNKSGFDPLEWGVPPSIVPATDTTQLLALIVAKMVLKDALGTQFQDADLSRTSCILGVTSAQELLGTMVNRLQRPVWVKALREMGYAEDEVQQACDKISSNYVDWQESTFPGLLGNVVAGRIANRLDFGGTNCVTDAACASSFSALSMGVNELRLGQSDMAIVGGCDTMNDIFMYMCFSKTPALSKSGDCRPFSDKADGTLLGEGLGMVALKRLSDAINAHDRIYAVIQGVGSSSDGRSKSVYAPVPKGQSVSILRAYESAGYGPDSVELVEAHGTGTKAGDAAEFDGLKLAFNPEGAQTESWCALGTVKSQIGHTKAAAGAAGLFKVIMALHHKVLPPTIKIDKPNPKMGIEGSPFYLNTETRPWIRGSDHPRRAAVSSFGFGGSNFHITVEEYVGENPASRMRTLPSELVVLSADAGSTLAAHARKLADEARGHGNLPWLAWSTQQGFDPMHKARLAIVADDAQDLATKLDLAAKHLAAKPDADMITPTGVYYTFGAEAGKVAFLFPGQGSQYLGMGGQIAMSWSAALEPWDGAADLDFGGERLQDVVFPKPVFDDTSRKHQLERLTRTEWAQPAIGAASLSQLSMLEALGVTADAVAGHSYGEITALAAAGAITRSDVIRIARMRGELMAEAASSHDGAMTAIPRTIDEVRAIADTVPGVVVANHNAPTQVVLSGTTQAIEQVEKKFLAAGIEPKRLPVATAFHSPVVADSAKPFGKFLDKVKFSAPTIPVWSNTEAAPYPSAAKAMRQILGQQIANPVRFVEQIEGLYADGVRTFIEVGPGRVLTNLSSEILGSRPHVSVSLDHKRKPGVTSLLNGLARMAVSGIGLRWSALWQGYDLPTDPTLVPAPKLSLGIDGSNYGKPYPPKGGSRVLPKPNAERIGAAAGRDRVVIQEVVREVEKVVVHEVVREVPVAAAPSPGAVSMPSEPIPTAYQPALSPAAPAQAAADSQWIQAFNETQRATAHAHAAWQQAMSESHVAFLQAMDQSFTGLTAVLTGGTQPAATRPTWAQAPQPAPTFAAAPQSPQLQLGSISRDTVAPANAWSPTPAASSEAPMLVQSGVDLVPRPAARPAPAPAAPAAPAAPTLDLEGLMLDVVADKTGYPADMLSMEMELESDLGVDSIKRVEILSAMRERAPELPEVDAGEMASLATLGQIVAYMRDQLPAGTAPVSAAPRAAAPAPAAGLDLEALMLSVVADKTGYPADMLGLQMELESDLGVDSIKRVEILSAMRERAPELPEVDAGEMASLQTLGQIVDYMRDQLPAGATTSGGTVRAPAAPSAALDLEGLMMSVVADKTGYPADMLGLHMELESDLGVDSIKRVEILSAMRERAPELPEVDAGEMAGLQTLGQIVDYMREQLGASAPVAAPAAGAALDLEGLMMSVVADKTGYPAAMLGLAMELESDLGIDSIKRVEILSAMRERAPELPEVDAGEMAALQTLGQIVEYMRAQLPTAGAPAAAPAAPAASGLDLEGLMLDVVADKTGYPAAMLGLHMELESDLGIDSIKRVEILSAMRERAPELPEVDAGEMAQLVTLGQIVEYMRGQTGAPAAAPSTPAATAPAGPPLGRFALEAVRAAAAGLALPGLGGKVEVLGHDSVGKALVKELAKQGVTAKLVKSVSPDADAVVYLGGLRDGSVDELCAVNREAFEVAHAIAPRFAERGGLFVTVQDTGGDFGLGGTERPWVGGLAGLVKTASQEWPKAMVQAVDIERGKRSPAKVAAALADALLSGGVELEVGIKADDSRWILRSVERATDGKRPSLSAGDVVVASGGARGVTAATLIALAAATKVRLALLGRTPLIDEPASVASARTDSELKSALLAAGKASGAMPKPAELGRQVNQILANREIRETLRAIEAAGGKARYEAVDVNDAAAVSAALDTVRADWGPIAGVIHGAGVLADKLIAEKTTEQFDFVFDTKVGGLRVLLDATAKDPLKALVCFSSVAGRCGNQGQCDYAMANEVLNKVANAEAARRKDCTVRSMGWGPWEGGMVTPGLKAHFERLGVPLIPLQTGAKMLVDELSDGGSDVELVLGGEPRMGPLAAEAKTIELRMAVRPSKMSHAYLKDHTIAGVPVVPVVLAVEWFARAARALRPDLHLARITDVKVLRGIKLPHFDAGGDWLEVRAREVSNGAGAILAVEIRGSDDTLHYSASAEMTQAAQIHGGAAVAMQLESWKGKEIYDGNTLFHGADFQVIQKVDGIGDAGITATLNGTLEAGWATEPWKTDPAAMDGGLQLALLWSEKVLGGASLPMAVGSMHSYADAPGAGVLHATLQGTKKGRDRAVSDIVFTDENGTVVAELRGVETILRPN